MNVVHAVPSIEPEIPKEREVARGHLVEVARHLADLGLSRWCRFVVGELTRLGCDPLSDFYHLVQVPEGLFEEITTPCLLHEVFWVWVLATSSDPLLSAGLRVMHMTTDSIQPPAKISCRSGKSLGTFDKLTD